MSKISKKRAFFQIALISEIQVNLIEDRLTFPELAWWQTIKFFYLFIHHERRFFVIFIQNGKIFDETSHLPF